MVEHGSEVFCTVSVGKGMLGCTIATATHHAWILAVVFGGVCVCGHALILGAPFTAAAPFKPTLCLWQTEWPVKEFVVHKKENVSLGVDLYQVSTAEVPFVQMCVFHN